ncbi:F0F1 ATP synthase subunit B [Pseudolysobacter antarcticus]|uniref:ATP synthase subunit b n=1 Tax=Pseudolysobacter antarcticus TaxID=2511995 RepID=A0A411HKW1_9GAMM|nr:F0F1 ATP synthase subunit B [Pseudolysobacter antarcticus]QBB71155.1 F0F1 ATP synthase subunit B [Pseudolysobacter antarcticus]
MLIDWFTVGAQALNFVVLVWLMKRFLYRPILNAIDAREKLIAGKLADASAKQADAAKDQTEFEKKNAEFDQQRAALLKKATDEANTERQRLLDEARKAADDLSAKREQAMLNDAQQLSDAIAKRTEAAVFAITRKTLGDLATASLQERMSEVFIRRLQSMDAQAKASLDAALKSASEPALVRCAFDLPPEQQAAIQKSINETFAADIPLRFETKPALVSGIELSSNGQKLGWSIADYLSSMQTSIGALLKSPAKVETAVAAAKLEIKSA